MMRCFRCNEDEIEREKAVMRNGRLLLEKKIAINDGRGNPIRSFSIQDLNNATNNYNRNQLVFHGALYKLYRGFLHRPVIVKRYNKGENFLEESINDIVFSSQLSVHKNVLKLLGCCLESPIPILVYEVAEKGTLHDYIIRDRSRKKFQPLSWRNRLKIAIDLANVIAYLHTAFPRPILHRNITSQHILLDEDYRAKLSEFSFSMLIPEGETHIRDAICCGTTGYIAPENFAEGLYFFEVLEKCVKENERIDNLMDPIIVEEGTWSGKEQQLKAYANLTLQCLQYRGEDRPEITDVGKQLSQIYQFLLISTCVRQA
ncbi:serine/threonine-protein kinase ZRK1-like isoform X2 [Manihot esculenta]|uniref:Uncharacterized protein n=1 Tax=Manihot esculenta TaxID=3983 RepID=A0ACB7H7V9_MANES|nr:serine/threonine-protein kinase ZRK1 isoform X2 [Manihot esculenta]XP_043815642.1 serine/threonine-protein kinase ZRK1-like isoform X2 [Manihot esculenta]KAG8648276.1 hypothetical protein MANES_09G168450v8 [Manihot esculenta]